MNHHLIHHIEMIAILGVVGAVVLVLLFLALCASSWGGAVSIFQVFREHKGLIIWHQIPRDED